MSGSEPTSIVLERLARLTTAVADMMEAHAAQSRGVNRLLDSMGRQLARMEEQQATTIQEIRVLTAEMRNLASEQVLLGNRVEEAFSRALRTDIRLDEMEAPQG